MGAAMAAAASSISRWASAAAVGLRTRGARICGVAGSIAAAWRETRVAFADRAAVAGVALIAAAPDCATRFFFSVTMVFPLLVKTGPNRAAAASKFKLRVLARRPARLLGDVLARQPARLLGDFMRATQQRDNQPPGCGETTQIPKRFRKPRIRPNNCAIFRRWHSTLHEPSGIRASQDSKHRNMLNHEMQKRN